MEKKNRFSTLLQQLMDTAGLKNYILAKELQYDVSYISKWVSGRMIPSEKSATQVLRGMSHCIVSSAGAEALAQLMQDYEVSIPSDLELAIYDNLAAEYAYCKDLQKRLGSSIAPETYYFADLDMPQFISQMRHPVLRRVKSLEIMASIDLMAIGWKYRLQIAGLDDSLPVDSHYYPNVHYSLLINTDVQDWDYLYNTIFLLNMLTYNLHIDFRLYSCPQSAGRVVFTVKDDFAITGMLAGGNHCMSVAVSENPQTCNTLYYYVSELCRREMLLFRRTAMADLLLRHLYAHTPLSPHPRWLLGHLTEHFLPDDLFEELLGQVSSSEALPTAHLRHAHHLAKGVLAEAHIQLMIYASAFSELATVQELDFFGTKVKLTPKQQLCYLEHMRALLINQENLEPRLIYGRFVSDFQDIAKPTIFLSDVFSYLRLDNGMPQINLLILNRADVQTIFDNFYQQAWNFQKDVVISDRHAVVSYLQHVIQGIHLISGIE